MPLRFVRWAPLLALVMSCGDDAPLQSQALEAGASVDASTCSEAASDACPSPSPSYATDVVPILDRRCNNCHAENSDGGPWPLGGYDAVHDWRDAIKSDLLRCSMPPPDSGTIILDDERALLVAWINCGAPNN